MSGFNDPRFRFSMNFYGALALSLNEFAGCRQDVIVGASLQVTAPLGQYDNSKLINLGNNRWSFKPELGISKAWGAWTAEITPSVTFDTDNTDFNQGRTFAQAPLYAVQGDSMQTSTRAGLTLALPVDRYNSLKLYASTGTSTRTGRDFSAVGVAWQHRWGGGY